MNKYDVVAEVAIKAINKEMQLRKTISEPAYEYYCRGGILGFIAGVLVICLFIWLLIQNVLPAWGFVLFALAITGNLESARQRDRFNALVDLMEIEKNKKEANKTLEVTARKLAEPQG